MRTVRPSIAVEEATAPSHPLSTPALARRSRQPSPPRSKTVYFHACIYTMDNAMDAADDPEIVEELHAGKTYVLAITCDDTPSSLNKQLEQDGKAISGSFALTLSYAYDANVTTPITPSKEVFTFPALFDEYQYKFTLPEDLPSCHLSILLKLTTPQRTLPVKVVRYTLPVCAQKQPLQPPLDLEVLQTCHIDQRLPAQTALLLVETALRQATPKQSVHLRGWNEAGQQLDHAAPISAILSIERLQEYRRQHKMQALLPDEILSRLTNFSRHCPPPLLHWLHTLFLPHQEPFNLIIVDATDREIPWELIEMKKGLYLGAYARVVRWLPTQYFEMTRDLSVKPHTYEGPVISYLDDHLGPALIQYERDALQLLAGQTYSSLSALKRRLADSLEDVGLIYIGCHGRAGRDLLQQNVPELSSIMLEDLYDCPSPKLTVFMNACESARIINKSPDDHSNFVDTFLGYCASGFIGPLVQVDIATASRIAQKVLLAALQPGGVHIAEMLRLLRKNELERFSTLKRNASATPADSYRVIDTFMYIYYGNPLAHLRLYPRKEAGQ